MSLVLHSGLLQRHARGASNLNGPRFRKLVRLTVCFVLGRHVATSAFIPFQSFEGEWYGPGVQNRKVLRRLIQTHRVRTSTEQSSGLTTVVANKLDGDWERGDVGAKGELLWRFQSDAPGLKPCGPGVRAEVQVCASDGGQVEKAAVIAISENQLLLVSQRKTFVYRRAGCSGLERVFRCIDGAPSRPLRRIFFDYHSAAPCPELIASGVPIVEVSHLWRARGALMVAVLPKGSSIDASPSLKVLAAMRELQSTAPADPHGPRLVFLWPWYPQDAKEIETLASAKSELGDSAEIYVDEAGVVLDRLAEEADTQGPAVLLAAVGRSGEWQALRTNGDLPPPASWTAFISAMVDLLNVPWITRFDSAGNIRAYPRSLADGETPSNIRWVRND